MALKDMLSDRELKICLEVGCSPEEFMKAKVRHETAKRGLSPEVAKKAIQALGHRRPATISRTPNVFPPHDLQLTRFTASRGVEEWPYWDTQAECGRCGATFNWRDRCPNCSHIAPKHIETEEEGCNQ